jgi:Phage capsid protein
MPLHRVRTISKGKSATFPLTGYASAEYHTPGTMIDPNKVKHGERIVTVDDLLISPLFIASIDEAMNHYDVRGIYAKEAGSALARQADRNIFRTVAKAAFITDSTKAAAEFGTAFDDEVYTANQTIGTVAGDATDPTKIVSAIYKAVEEFTKKNVPFENAVVVLAPEQYFALLNVSDTTKATWLNRDVGGAGSVAGRAVPMVAGLPVMMSNHLPQTNQTTTLSDGDEAPITTSRAGKYKGDFAKIKGLIFTPDAAASVKLMDLGLESEYQIERQGTLIVAKYAMGHNILRPACAQALLSA